MWNESVQSQQQQQHRSRGEEEEEEEEGEERRGRSRRRLRRFGTPSSSPYVPSTSQQRDVRGVRAPPPTPDHILMPPPNVLVARPIAGMIAKDGRVPSPASMRRGRVGSPATIRAPPPSPQIYRTKEPFMRPPMPPSPILRQPKFTPRSPLRIGSNDDERADDAPNGILNNPARAHYNTIGTTSRDIMMNCPSRARYSPNIMPRPSPLRSPSPTFALMGSASPASALSQQLNAHHLTQRSFRQSTSGLLQSVAASMTLMKAAEDADKMIRRNQDDDDDRMDEEDHSGVS